MPVLHMCIFNAVMGGGYIDGVDANKMVMAIFSKFYLQNFFPLIFFLLFLSRKKKVFFMHFLGL